MYSRLAERQIKEALADTPVVLITGPRRAGKTTLARMSQTGERHSRVCGTDKGPQERSAWVKALQ